MTEEFAHPPMSAGWIEVISGCMFSGKTEELIRQVRRAQIAKQTVQIFKPRIDARYSVNDVASHNQTTIAAELVQEAREIAERVKASTSVVAIDEGQFLGDELVAVCTELANQGRRVIVAGLDTDWRARPFGPMPQLLAIAEVVRKQHAICMVCGAPATRTFRLVSSHDVILVGSTEAYEARCRTHFLTDNAGRFTLESNYGSIAPVPPDQRRENS